MTLWKSEMWWLYDKTTSYIVMYEDPSIACKVQKSRQTLMKNKEVLLCYKSLGVKFFLKQSFKYFERLYPNNSSCLRGHVYCPKNYLYTT